MRKASTPESTVAHAGDATFLTAASQVSGIPRLPYPQVAFAGRSNVGKSSLLNRLVARRALARVSKTPGRTQQINFFLIGGSLVFSDLPGYGFARVPVAIKEGWKHLVEAYLRSPDGPGCAVVIVDLRRGVEADDRQLLEFLGGIGVDALVVATKSDRVKRGQRRAQIAAIEERLPAGTPLFVCSSVSGEGIAALWQDLRRRCGSSARGRGG